MRIVNLLEEPLHYENQLGAFHIERIVQGEQTLEQESDHLRFFLSLSPLEVAAQGTPLIVPERSTVKVHPGMPIQVNAGKETEIYVVHFLQDERSFLNNLQRVHRPFFQELTGKEKQEWEQVKDQDLDYILTGEKNAEHIVRKEGVVIAPSHSRFCGGFGQAGWTLGYARASRAFGIASDVVFRVREEEVTHQHRIITEPYLCLGGALEITINGILHAVGKNQVILTEPGEVHVMSAVRDLPYIGSTMHFPSVPGDRYTAEGKKI